MRLIRVWIVFRLSLERLVIFWRLLGSSVSLDIFIVYWRKISRLTSLIKLIRVLHVLLSEVTPILWLLNITIIVIIIGCYGLDIQNPCSWIVPPIRLISWLGLVERLPLVWKAFSYHFWTIIRLVWSSCILCVMNFLEFYKLTFSWGLESPFWPRSVNLWLWLLIIFLIRSYKRSSSGSIFEIFITMNRSWPPWFTSFTSQLAAFSHVPLYLLIW